MIKIFEANYPESLGAILVHRAPWAFNAIWHIIKGWLDPVVAAKVHFTSNVEELSQYIEMSHIPEALGGKDPWQYQYIPPIDGENTAIEDTSARQRLEHQRDEIVNAYELATLKWVKQSNSAPLRAERAALRETLRKGYWDLDPYVRARSLCDRTGMIQRGGRIEFYPGETRDRVENGTGGEMGVQKVVNGVMSQTAGDKQGTAPVGVPKPGADDDVD